MANFGRSRLLRQFLDARKNANRGNGNAPQGNAHAFGIGENLHGLGDLRQVQQRLTHSHEHQVQPRLLPQVLLRRDGQHLPDDFACRQVALGHRAMP